MKSQSKIYSRYFTYIKPFTKSPIVKTYGSTIFSLLIITVFIFLAIKPTVETILVLQKELADAKQVLEKVNQKSKDLSLGKQNLEQMPFAVKSKLETAIPETVSLRSLIQTLEQTALSHDASVSALQIQPLTIGAKKDNQAVGSLSEIAFIFNAQGEYKNLVALLQELKSSDRLVSIDSMSLSKLSEGPGLLLSISGKAFYIK